MLLISSIYIPWGAPTHRILLVYIINLQGKLRHAAVDVYYVGLSSIK